MTTPCPLCQTLSCSLETWRGLQTFAGSDSRKAVLSLCWSDRIDRIMDLAPSGSGLDSGVILDRESSGPAKLVFQCDFHHMDEHGYYAGWTEHKAIVTPSFRGGIDIKITGRNRNQIKDLIHDLIHHWLTMGVDVPLNMDPVLRWDIEQAQRKWRLQEESK